MQRLTGFLGVIAVTALVTYLLVADYYRREQVNTLRRELGRAQAELTRLHEDLVEAQRELSVRNGTRIKGQPVATNAESQLRVSSVPAATVRAARQNTTLLQNEVTVAANVNQWPAVPLAVLGGRWMSYEPDTGSWCSVQGTSSTATGTSSNGQRWELQSRAIGGSLDLDPRLRIDSPAANVLSGLGSNIAARAEVVIPIRTLKSQAAIGAAFMDQQVQTALDAARYPRVAFRLHRLTLWNSAKSTALQFHSQGVLEIRGRTNQIHMPVSIASHQGSRLRVSGRATVHMSDYGIAPPLAPGAAGQDQAEDDVSISFEWFVQRSITSLPELTEEAR